MRILFYGTDEGWSGSARLFAEAATGLRERGHQVTYVCRPDSRVEAHLDVTAHEVLPLPADGPWPLVAQRLRRVMTERFIEVVLVHGEREQLIAAAAARWAERSAILRWVPHGQTPALGPAARLASRMAATGLLVATDEALAAALALPDLRIRAHLVPFGVDVAAQDEVRPAQRTSLGERGVEQLIACVYGPGSRHRAATVLRVLARLAPRHPELHLAFVGPGSKDEELRMHGAALRVTRQVSFLGDRTDALAILRAADLGWVVAEGDDAAFALLDLQAARIPPIAERTMTTEQYVADGITGFLLASPDVPEIAAAVTRLIAQKEERAAMGAAARARVIREFSIGPMLDAIEGAVQAAADRSQW